MVSRNSYKKFILLKVYWNWLEIYWNALPRPFLSIIEVFIITAVRVREVIIGLAVWSSTFNRTCLTCVNDSCLVHWWRRGWNLGAGWHVCSLNSKCNTQHWCEPIRLSSTIVNCIFNISRLLHFTVQLMLRWLYYLWWYLTIILWLRHIILCYQDGWLWLLLNVRFFRLTRVLVNPVLCLETEKLIS